MATAASNLGSKFAGVSPWIVIASLATLAGLILPQMMPGAPPVNNIPMRSESKDKTNLEYTAPALPEPPNFQGMMLRLGAGTILVLGLSVGAIWAMRRWMSPIVAPMNGERVMRVKETLPLGNRCSLHWVTLGKRELVVAVDGAGIKAVQTLTEAFDEVLTDADTPPVAEKTVV